MKILVCRLQWMIMGASSYCLRIIRKSFEKGNFLLAQRSTSPWEGRLQNQLGNSQQVVSSRKLSKIVKNINNYRRKRQGEGEQVTVSLEKEKGRW